MVVRVYALNCRPLCVITCVGGIVGDPPPFIRGGEGGWSFYCVLLPGQNQCTLIRCNNLSAPSSGWCSSSVMCHNVKEVYVGTKTKSCCDDIILDHKEYVIYGQGTSSNLEKHAHQRTCIAPHFLDFNTRQYTTVSEAVKVSVHKEFIIFREFGVAV